MLCNNGITFSSSDVISVIQYDVSISISGATYPVGIRHIVTCLTSPDKIKLLFTV